MSRMKKEAIRKRQEARKGLTVEEAQALETKEREDSLIEKLASIRHIRMFPEEYDFIYDSIAEAAERRRGINPMNNEYQEKIKEKRERLGVSPLLENGNAQSDDTRKLCLREAQEEIDSIRTRIDEILFYQWDPIRLSKANAPRDEYASYVKEVFEIVLNSTKPDTLADHLTVISTESIGLATDRERDMAVAALIFAIVHDEDYHPEHSVVDID